MVGQLFALINVMAELVSAVHYFTVNLLAIDGKIRHFNLGSHLEGEALGYCECRAVEISEYTGKLDKVNDVDVFIFLIVLNGNLDITGDNILIECKRTVLVCQRNCNIKRFVNCHILHINRSGERIGLGIILESRVGNLNEES